MSVNITVSIHEFQAIARMAAISSLSQKLVFVGDDVCGETSLLIASKGQFPEDYVPTAFDNFVKNIKFDGKHIELLLWDTFGTHLGHSRTARLRPIASALIF